MAWTKKYQIPFQSFGGTQYMVYIYERGDTQGTVTQLTGAAEPFTTQEDDNDDIFTPIRKQTGYLRVLDDQGTLLETLIPSNNTEKMVRLYSGTWNAAMTTFTDGTIQWQGFLCAQAYTQPWDNGSKVIEFPVKSVLAAMEDVSYPEWLGVRTENIAMYIYRAFMALDLFQSPDNPTNVYLVTDFNVAVDELMQKVSSQIFRERKTGHYDDPDAVWYDSIQIYDALSMIMSFYGMILREKGNNIYITKYDTLTGDINVWYYSWGDFENISNGIVVQSLGTTLPSLPITGEGSTAVFVGADNVEGFVQGAKAAKVEVAIKENDLDVIMEMHDEQPGGGASQSQITVNNYASSALGTVLVEYSQTAPSSSYEIYTYQIYERLKITQGSSERYQFWWLQASNYTACRTYSVINPDYPQPQENDGVAYVYTGAFPCRWFYRQGGAEVNYRNGLFIVQNDLRDGIDEIDSLTAIYSLHSSQSFALSDCYIRINIEMLRFYIFSRPFYGDSLCFPVENVIYNIGCRMRVGNAYWTGSGWGNDSTSSFFITFNGKNIQYPEDIPGIDMQGWFIPIQNTGITGQIEFTILSLEKHYQQASMAHYYDAIIQTLEIGVVYPSDPTANTRGNNTYQQLVSAGFNGEKVINLNLGTDNNNTPSPTFVLDKNGALFDTIPYNGENNLVSYQRPEVNLLARMVQQYGTVRRTLKGILQSGLDVLTTKYTYKNTNFFGVSASHNWRDDEEEVKFIEVT